MGNTYYFAERLAFSKDTRLETDTATIQAMLPGSESVTVASEAQDRVGIDYIATLRGGAKVNIDLKCREAGCSRFWRNGPEFALEDWSVLPENGSPGKAGWTLDESKETDLVLFAFDPSDSPDCFLVSFQLLRVAFKQNHASWLRTYFDANQQSDSWRSHCVFVPAAVVLDAIQRASVGQLVN